MDLIYTNQSRVDVGVLHDYELDHEASTSPGANTFEITHPLKNNVLNIGYYWYIDGTEYGGKVDAIKIDTSTDLIKYCGRTWRGMLASKIISPLSGQDYYVVSGDLNDIISSLINYVSISALFKGSASRTKTVSSYKFDRYTDVLSGLTKLLSQNGYKLMFRWDNGKVEVSAIPFVDWANVEEISSDLFDFVIEKDKGAPNHIIGLGSGDLKDRLVVHRYIGPDGEIRTTQYYTGLDEVVEAYDLNNTESMDDLVKYTEDHIKQKSVEDKLEVRANNIEADIGDSFTAVSLEAGITIKQYVTNKITNITETSKSAQYMVGSTMY